MPNPLLQPYDLPPFAEIRAEHVKPAIEQILADNRAQLDALLAGIPVVAAGGKKDAASAAAESADDGADAPTAPPEPQSAAEPEPE